MTNQQVMTIQGNEATTNPVLGVATTVGVGGVLLMGIVSWVTMLVNRGLPMAVVLGIALVSFASFAFLSLRNFGARAPRVGAMAGVMGGVVSVLFLGSLMVEQVDSLVEFQARNAAGSGQNGGTAGGLTGAGIGLWIGVTVGMAAIGWVMGKVAGGSGERPAKDVDWRARFAWVAALSYLPLIAVGGLVTSTESGLAVPDSVTTYGSVSILFPLSLMEEIRIYLEHSHRIFGTFAGLATVILVVRMLGAPGRMLPRVMSVVLLLGVIAQGAMGALRVAEQSSALAALHGVLAQLVFALAIATGVVSSRRWGSAAPSDEGIVAAKSARLMLALATVGLFIQLVFGSMTRHLDSGHALMSHIGFSFVVVVLVIIAGAKCIKLGKLDKGSAAIRPYGATVHGLVVLQFTLGWGALAMTRTGGQGQPPLPTSTELATAHGIRVAEAAITTTHHMTGALLLAAVVGALVWSLRLASRPKNG